jgi:hypothetical protein
MRRTTASTPSAARSGSGAVLYGTILALAAAALVVTSCSLDMSYEKYAVVFGVADYLPLGAGGPDLNYTDDDATAMAARLAADGYTVWGAGGPGSGETTDSDATEANFSTILADIAAVAKEEDLFLFYFSGHGGQVYVNGSEPDSADDPYEEFIAFNGDPVSAFTEEDLAAALSVLPCLKKIVIIDACNSGGFIGDSADVDGVPSIYRGTIDGPLAEMGAAISVYFGGADREADITPGEAIVLAAAGEREYSYEDDATGSWGFEHGVFTYFLLEASASGDRNRDGYVTVTEAYDYVRRAIDEKWNAEVVYSDRFAPHVSGGPLDYVLFGSP